MLARWLRRCAARPETGLRSRARLSVRGRLPVRAGLSVRARLPAGAGLSVRGRLPAGAGLSVRAGLCIRARLPVWAGLPGRARCRPWPTRLLARPVGCLSLGRHLAVHAQGVRQIKLSLSVLRGGWLRYIPCAHGRVERYLQARHAPTSQCSQLPGAGFQCGPVPCSRATRAGQNTIPL